MESDFNLKDFLINPNDDPSSPAPSASYQPCEICRRLTLAVRGPYCLSCLRKYPAALIKATGDEFEYALKLSTGEVFFFASAKIEGESVHLELARYPRDQADIVAVGCAPPPLRPCLFARGVDVRARDIVWCCDAPFDS